MGHKQIPYGRQWVTEEDIQKVIHTLRGDWITQGPGVKNFEEVFAEYCGAKFAVAVSSGTAGLHLAALAAGFNHGDEIITSPITFVASANCVLYTGAIPIFADIDEDTICLDVQEVEKHLSSNTRGLIPVHFAGHPCDMPSIWELAVKNNLKVIEDASHAIGASYIHQGIPFKVGSCAHSHMTCFSFHPDKHITTGEGGAITTNDEDLYQVLLQLRSHGITKDPEHLIRDDGPWYYEMQELGFNYRITDFQCALGLSQLTKLDGFVARRMEITRSYYEAFRLMDEIILPQQGNNVTSSWHLYIIQLKTLGRRKVFEQLQKKGLGVQVHYIPVHFHPYYNKKYRFKKGDFPKAEQYYERAISIPLFPGMSGDDVDYVVGSLTETITELSE